MSKVLQVRPRGKHGRRGIRPPARNLAPAPRCPACAGDLFRLGGQTVCLGCPVAFVPTAAGWAAPAATPGGK